MLAEQPTAKKKAGVKKVAGKKKKDAAGCCRSISSATMLRPSALLQSVNIVLLNSKCRRCAGAKLEEARSFQQGS